MKRLRRMRRMCNRLLRVWLALRRQKKRRRGAGASVVVPAPVITSGWCEWAGTTPDVGDAVVEFTFDDSGLPVGTFEVYIARESTGWQFVSFETIPSTARSLRDSAVFDDQIIIRYELRYRNGDVVGPFSQPFDVDGLKG